MNILWFIGGAIFGAALVKFFNPKDITISGKVNAKKGARVDFNNNLKNNKDGFFKRNFRRRKRMGRDS